MSVRFSLRGHHALVTGGGRGIGAAAAQLLAEAGADVCVGYHSRHDDAARVQAACTAYGVRATSFAADLSTAAGAHALVDHAVTAFGSLDICVHSAGIWPVDDAPVTALTDARWGETMRQNVDAMFFVSRAATAAMLATRPAASAAPSAPAARVAATPGGRLVLIASTAAQRGEAGHADYAASKGAMISFVKSLAVEVAVHGITVNAVAPGWVDTEMCAIPFAHGGRARIAAAIPVGRVATPEDIAFPAVCLCFPAARHVTGEIVNVNGGSVLCG